MTNKQSNAGRKTKRSPEVTRKIEEAAAFDASVEEMAYYADINVATLYRWMEEDPKLKERIKALRERPVLLARQTVVKSLNDPNHAFKYLEKKKRKEFGNSMDITTDGEKIVEASDEVKKLAELLNNAYKNNRTTGGGSYGIDTSSLGS